MSIIDFFIEQPGAILISVLGIFALAQRAYIWRKYPFTIRKKYHSLLVCLKLLGFIVFYVVVAGIQGIEFSTFVVWSRLNIVWLLAIEIFMGYAELWQKRMILLGFQAVGGLENDK